MTMHRPDFSLATARTARTITNAMVALIYFVSLVGLSWFASLVLLSSPRSFVPLAIAGSGSLQSGLTQLAGLKEEVVLAGAVTHGNSLDVNRFKDARSAPILLDEVRKVWSQRPAPIQVMERDGWLTMIQVVGATIESFEVRPAGPGTEGRRIRWRRDEKSPVEDADWLERALPRGSRVLDRVSHQDGGRRMTTLVAVTNDTLPIASRNLTAALTRKGFSGEPRATPSLKGSGMVFFMARGSEEIAVTISEHASGRAIVMHWGRAMQ